MEYGLILGNNKYVIPFQRTDQSLPFNVSGLDTVKYDQGNFKRLATEAIDRAISETAQAEPAQSVDQILSVFTLIKNAAYVNVQNSNDERLIFESGRIFGFNLLIKFDGLSYVYIGNFTMLSGNSVIWRLNKLLELIEARLKMVPTRIQMGLGTEQGKALLEAIMQRLEIWLILNATNEETEVKSWLADKQLPFLIEIFTLSAVAKVVEELPR